MAQTEDLALAIRRGDQQALSELYHRYGGAVYNLALRITQDEGTAEEISLDTFLQIWRQASRFDGAHGTLVSWLFTIARSRAIDRLRARSAAKRTQSFDATVAVQPARPDEMVDEAERRRLVRTAVASLPPGQRDALELAYYEGLSHSQIAARLGEPLGTVKTRIRQAMHELRRTLEPVLSTPR